MGLGKSFTTISFVVSLLTNPEIRSIMDPVVKNAKQLDPIESTTSSQVEISLSQEMDEYFHKLQSSHPRQPLSGL